MHVEDRKFVGIFVWSRFLNAGRPLIFPDISHELGLQALGTEFAADMQSAFAHGNLVIPGAEVEHGTVEFEERRPHQPPVIGEYAATRLPASRQPCGRFAALTRSDHCHFLAVIERW